MAHRSPKKSSRKNCKPQVFFIEVRFWPAICTVAFYASDKKGNIPFLFACSAQTTERVGNQLPGC